MEALDDEDSDTDDVEAAGGIFKGNGGGDSNDALWSSTGPTENKLLFVHQEPWQQELLKRYRKYSMIDATYRTARYHITLFFFFIVVPANVSVMYMFIKAENAARLD